MAPGGRNLEMLPPIGSIVKPTFAIAAVNAAHGIAPRESERKSLRNVLIALGEANMGSALSRGLHWGALSPVILGVGVPWVLGLVWMLLGWAGSVLAESMKGSKGTSLLL